MGNAQSATKAAQRKGAEKGVFSVCSQCASFSLCGMRLLIIAVMISRHLIVTTIVYSILSIDLVVFSRLVNFPLRILLLRATLTLRRTTSE